ncbi:hypothetical protein GCM10009710_15490 [Aeromicrobium alkaliterrae]|uniref:Uncharacterized protein n=1 Tax=Aeromicrobium alkaliterrae TaxID=302168 RepID=A0ABP4VUR0_9ACTN
MAQAATAEPGVDHELDRRVTDRDRRGDQLGPRLDAHVDSRILARSERQPGGLVERLDPVELRRPPRQRGQILIAHRAASEEE